LSFDHGLPCEDEPLSGPALYYLIAAALVVIGLIGTVLPALPGLPLVFAGMLLAAWAGGFEQVGVATVVVLGVLTLVSLAIDFWATAHGAKRVGASRLAIIGAIVGTFAGLMFGPIGIFVGPFAGALVGELLHGRRLGMGQLGQATKVGAGTWLGIVLGVVLKLTLAFAMIGLFALAWLY
jgi:uncharacterized protein YqgC (DUF456 family)